MKELMAFAFAFWDNTDSYIPSGRPPVLIRFPGRLSGGVSMEEMGQILTMMVQVQTIGVTVQMILKK
jgi:hypothetical protein